MIAQLSEYAPQPNLTIVPKPEPQQHELKALDDTSIFLLKKLAAQITAWTEQGCQPGAEFDAIRAQTNSLAIGWFDAAARIKELSNVSLAAF